MACVRFGLALLAVSCAGDKTASTGETGTPAGAPTFSQVRDEVFHPTCGTAIGCHTATDVNGMNLPEGGEYAELVNVESTFLPGQFYVVPGDADHSYVVLKMEGAVGITGTPMPPPFGDLDPELIGKIRAWIDAGALDN